VQALISLAMFGGLMFAVSRLRRFE